VENNEYPRSRKSSTPRRPKYDDRNSYEPIQNDLSLYNWMGDIQRRYGNRRDIDIIVCVHEIEIYSRGRGERDRGRGGRGERDRGRGGRGERSDERRDNEGGGKEGEGKMYRRFAYGEEHFHLIT
jgi:hypothetical protein